MREFWNGLLSARMDRRTYVVYTALYFATYFGTLRLLPGFPSAFVLPPLWMFFLAVPRLRDIGWHPLWSALPFAMGFASGMLKKIIPGAAGSLAIVVGLVSFAMVIGLALKRGDDRGRLDVFG